MKNSELASSLRNIASLMHKRLRREVKSVDNLSLTEVTTLSYLYTYGSMYPSELAEVTMVKAQSMSQIISHLDELKLIVKTPSETDKRKTAISLSAFGKQMVEQTRYERDEWLDDAIENNLSAAEKKTLQEAVVLMNKLVDYK